MGDQYTGDEVRWDWLGCESGCSVSVLGWTPFCLQNCLNSSWHRFNKVLETFFRDVGPY